MSTRILVVDDIEQNRRMLRARLEASYHDVIEAEAGVEAIEIAELERPSIILLDVMMPGIDGFETCRRLKSNPLTAHIPVVMVTALSDSEHRVQGLEAGAEDFLTKPIDEIALSSRIEALSRYNTVAEELRQRQASGAAVGAFDEQETIELGRPVRVFVLDELTRRANRTADILRSAGHTVVTLREADGMAALGETGVDIIVMPVSGQSFEPLKLCAHFRMSDRTRAISIIAAADEHDQDIAARAMKLGASDTVLMPIEPEELIARVRTQARRTRYIEIMRRRVDRGLELSVIDQLTGLYNRRYMVSQLQKWLQRSAMGGAPVSIVALDIDHFKQVNDTWGHQAGDGVLQDIATRLNAHVRPQDVVCRPGGEEFIIILPETAGDVACTAAERLRQAIAAEPFEVDAVPTTLDITVSAGVSTTSGRDDTPAALMKRADTALYSAKTEGRNRVKSLAA
ncbi:MAG: PleD family two-component system response regulator [Pseudomonadota bacterium]